MLFKREIKNWSSVLLLAGLATGVLFNSCSDVDFNNTPKKNTVKDISGGPICGEVGNCNETPVVVNETITVPVLSRKADILLVVDNSGSMTAEINELGQRLAGFVEILDQKQIDWQICHVLSEGSGETQFWKKTMNGQIVNTNQFVLTKAEPDRVSTFNTTMANIPKNGAGNERGITAMTNAVLDSSNADCFRSDAALSVIMLSDEDQQSCGGFCENHPGTANRSADEYRAQYRPMGPQDEPLYFVNQYKAKWGQKPMTVSSIIIQENDATCLAQQDQANPAFYGIYYTVLSRLTAGIFGSICAPSYAQQLAKIGDNIEASLASITLECPPLKVTKVAITPSTANYATRVDGNKIFFTPAVPSGNSVTVDYTCLKPKAI